MEVRIYLFDLSINWERNGVGVDIKSLGLGLCVVNILNFFWKFEMDIVLK